MPIKTGNGEMHKTHRDAWISCDEETSLKVEYLKRRSDLEGQVAEEGMEEEEDDNK